MATGPRYKVPFRRRRENRTDYYIRRKLLTGGELRAVVRRSSRNISIQFVRFGMGGDSVAASATSLELKAYGWDNARSNIPAAYLTGYLAGRKAVKAGRGHAVLDIGMQTPSKGAVLFAAVAGMTAAGVEIPHGDGVLPTEERLKGAHMDGNVAKNVDAVIRAVDGGKAEDAPAKKTAAKATGDEKRPAAKKTAAKAAGDGPGAKAADGPVKKPAVKKTVAKAAGDGPGAKKTAAKDGADKPVKRPAAKKKVKEAE